MVVLLPGWNAGRHGESWRHGLRILAHQMPTLAGSGRQFCHRWQRATDSLPEFLSCFLFFLLVFVGGADHLVGNTVSFVWPIHKEE